MHQHQERKRKTIHFPFFLLPGENANKKCFLMRHPIHHCAVSVTKEGVQKNIIFFSVGLLDKILSFFIICALIHFYQPQYFSLACVFCSIKKVIFFIVNNLKNSVFSFLLFNCFIKLIYLSKNSISTSNRNFVDSVIHF